MLDRELEILFIDFLLNKGYNKNNLLSQFSLKNEKQIFQPDLIIIDTLNKEYIGIIEFKNRIDRKVEEIVLAQFFNYFGYLGTKNIPAYLIIPIEKHDFQILELTKEHTFQPISKDDFPFFETLSAKRITEEKIIEREISIQKSQELNERKKRSKKSAFLAILSLVIGVLASIIALFFQQKGFEKPLYQSNICCDSIEHKYKKLQDKIFVLEKKINTNSKSDNKTDTIFINSNVISLEKRIQHIEIGISENPEKTLSILQVRQEIELLKKADDYSKELTQAKLDAIKSEIQVQNAWMLGILISVFGTILSLAIPNLLAKRNNSNNAQT
jgi:hypothetical protein